MGLEEVLVPVLGQERHQLLVGPANTKELTALAQELETRWPTKCLLSMAEFERATDKGLQLFDRHRSKYLSHGQHDANLTSLLFKV